MGVIEVVLNSLFGGSRNVIKDTVEVFRGNAEAASERAYDVQMEAMAMQSKEFDRTGKGGFDKLMDGVNRLPRPALALGTLGLFVSAMVSPLWFAERMQGIALVPEPLWWLLGVIVSFYFGARHQIKSQQFQRDLVKTVTRAPAVMHNIAALRQMRASDPKVAETGPDANLTIATLEAGDNAALEDWRRAA